jgi:selenide,water dikinase
VGGHTIQTEEPIFGLAVVGRADPRAVITNAGAIPGDFLILTKPLGLGIITTAAKRGEDAAGAIAEAITIMGTLNREASRVFAEAGAHALTDITGFGLLGHLRNLAAASQASAVVWADLVPVIEAAREYVVRGLAPGGTHANRRFLSDWVTYDPGISEAEQLLLCDAQTSGGLLAAVSGARVPEVVRKLRSLGAAATALIGSIEPGTPGRIRVGKAPQYAEAAQTERERFVIPPQTAPR